MIILNWFEVFVWALGLFSSFHKVFNATESLHAFGVMVIMTLIIIIPCGINGYLVSTIPNRFPPKSC